jgi:hypothetical protein
MNLVSQKFLYWDSVLSSLEQRTGMLAAAAAAKKT